MGRLTRFLLQTGLVAFYVELVHTVGFVTIKPINICAVMCVDVCVGVLYMQTCRRVPVGAS